MKAASKAAKEAKKDQLVSWAKELTLEDVVLTKEGDDAETLGVGKWSDLKGYVKMAFISARKIPIAQAFRLTQDLGKNVANEINCSRYKQKLKASRSKYKAAATKPDCIKWNSLLHC
jgi:hypothetical protein